MTDKHALSPGTVSKILWHFTGGPTWNTKTKRQSNSPKPSAKAYNNLKSILRTKELRLGTYKELVRFIVPKFKKVIFKTKTVEVLKNVKVDIESSSICCLSDIPAAHLRYHAYRYGKFAIGFHRDAIIRAGFNPVFYTLQDTPIVQSIYEGFSFLKSYDTFAISGVIRNAMSSIESQIDNIEVYYRDIDIDVSDEVGSIAFGTNLFDNIISGASESLGNLVAFIKTFDRSEFSTIYCEREWRSTKRYRFDINDVAMIVLPKTVGKTQYFKNFVENVAPNLKLPRLIPIVPWDDLVEH